MELGRQCPKGGPRQLAVKENIDARRLRDEPQDSLVGRQADFALQLGAWVENQILLVILKPLEAQLELVSALQHRTPHQRRAGDELVVEPDLGSRRVGGEGEGPHVFLPHLIEEVDDLGRDQLRVDLVVDLDP